MNWHPMRTAPRDGTIIVLAWFEDGKPAEQWPMRWNPRGKNLLVQEHAGIWETPDGSLTWSEEHPDGAPDAWRYESH